MAIVRRSLDIELDPLDAMRRLCRRASPLFLDSAASHSDFGRYTVLMCEPTGLLCTRTAGGTLIDFGGSRRILEEGPFAALAPGFRPFQVVEKPDDVPCMVGWAGYLGYEVGRFIERLPQTTKADIRLPVVRLGFYDTSAVYDHRTKRWTLVAVDLHHGYPPPFNRVVQGRLDVLESYLRAEEAARPVEPMHVSGKPRWNMTRPDYLRKVQRAIDYIAAGDIFQVNLTRRLSLSVSGHAWDLYERLRRSNPACYAAYMAWHEGKAKPSAPPTHAVLSSSPELFVEVHDRRVITKPIKGTRPRGSNPADDERLRQELIDSPKDRAELNMIVDLERNDLGRVCRYGSVRVVEPRSIEGYPTVWHSVATVEGILHERYDAIDLLKATLPGGSITGAPKVRAMEIIDELEPTQRSVYTGAIGILGMDGTVVFNLAIRTILVDGTTAHMQTGGGIVADSDPQSEYQETIDKARGMLRALEIEGSLDL